MRMLSIELTLWYTQQPNLGIGELIFDEGNKHLGVTRCDWETVGIVKSSNS